jgi:hypothetical protein
MMYDKYMIVGTSRDLSKLNNKMGASNNMSLHIQNKQLYNNV